MARRAYAGTGMLPGMEEAAEAPVRTSRAQPPAPPPPKRQKRRLQISTPRAVAWCVAALLLLGASLYAFHLVEQFLIRDPRFAVHGSADADARSTFEIFGAKHASRAAIESVFNQDMGRSVYLVPLEDRLMTLRTVDWVQEASVARVWPNRLLVHVEERKPVAFLRLPNARAGLIDAFGVILPPAKDQFDLPVLTGVSAGDSIVDRREAVGRMLALIGELGEDAAGISEINVKDRDNVVVSQSYHGRILKLMLGDRNFAVRYGNFLNHYDEIQTRLPGASVLDLRLETRITVVE